MLTQNTYRPTSQQCVLSGPCNIGQVEPFAKWGKVVSWTGDMEGWTADTVEFAAELQLGLLEEITLP